LKLLFIDLETTGTNPEKHGIHQIAGRVVIDGVTEETFDLKVQPIKGKSCDLQALEHCNVTLDELRAYPEPREVFRTFKKMLGTYVNKFDRLDKFYFVAYNADFDSKFLRKWFEDLGDEYYGSWFFYPSLDVVQIAGITVFGYREQLENFKLHTVCKHFGLEVDESKLHRAEYDIDLTHSLFEILVKRFKETTSCTQSH
jgi:DNA polymerase III subunit epsilon